MKCLFFLVTGILILTQSCILTPTKNENPSQMVETDSTQLLLDLFPTSNLPELHIYSPCDTINGNYFQGTLIDTGFYRFVNFNGLLNPLRLDTFSHIYSCQKLRLTDSTQGLIIRRPSTYDAAALDVYIWDNNRKKVINVFTLADSYGDAGWFFVQDGWLTDINHDLVPDIITRKKEYDQDLDNPRKIRKTDSLFIFLGNGSDFKRTSVSADTNHFQLYYWPIHETDSRLSH